MVKLTVGRTDGWRWHPENQLTQSDTGCEVVPRGRFGWHHQTSLRTLFLLLSVSKPLNIFRHSEINNIFQHKIATVPVVESSGDHFIINARC